MSISRKSPYHWIFQKLIQEAYEICVTTEILLEYAEIVERKMGHRVSEAFLGVFDNLNNVQYINTYFEFHLLEDEDDNKFVDYAIAANADYIVSHGCDFRKLLQVDFPKVEVIDIQEFERRMK